VFKSNDAFEGEFCAGIPIPEPTPLEHRKTSLEGEERECVFLKCCAEDAAVGTGKA
jgi:hypothetical protein